MPQEYMNQSVQRPLSIENKEKIKVFLNIYDLTGYNGCLKWLCLGAFHTAVEIGENLGIEYSFGMYDGVFDDEPGGDDYYQIFREKVFLGESGMEYNEIMDVL